MAAFVRDRGFEATDDRAEDHLELVTVHVPGFRDVSLRVAELENVWEAGAELERALLEREPGTWGLHRGNLAALAPQPAPHQDVLALNAKTKLACWGTLMLRAKNEVVVVGGGYLNL